MATYTTNYNLKKPSASDTVDISDINGNMDVIDTQLKAIPRITVDSSLSASSTNPVQNKVINTALGKKMDDLSVKLGNSSGGAHWTKFLSVDYSTMSQYGAKIMRVSQSSGHSQGDDYQFCQDVYLSVNYVGYITCNVLRQYSSTLSSNLPTGKNYGDIFYVNDTENRVVDFYVAIGQYTQMYMSPVKCIIGNTTNVTQYSGTGTDYSSGTQVWANIFDLALNNVATRPTYKGSGVALQSDIPDELADLTADSTHRTVTDTQISTWNGKQSALTFDSAPTANSTNPVTSGGVKTALDGKQDAFTVTDVSLMEVG